MKSKVNSRLFKERTGVYIIGEHRYDNKWDAMIKASELNTNFRYEFAPEVFNKIDWTIPIEISLDELYRMRLQQLRDEYDHLTLFFSGGKDSLNILMTSIKNNILIDEIVVYYPFAMEKYFNKHELDADNLYSEVEFAAKPLLKQLENQIDKRTKIRFQDNGHTNAEFLKNEDWFDLVRPSNTLQMVSPIYGSVCDPNFSNLAMQGKHSAIITGADKPRIVEMDRVFFFTFSDPGFNTISRPKSEEMKVLFGENVCFEAFYHTPFLPELVVKQAQVAAAAYDTDAYLRNVEKIYAHDMNIAMSERETILAKILYSDGIQPWQTRKHRKDLIRRGEKVVWETLTNDMKFNYTNGVKSITSRVDKRFFVDGDYIKGPKPSVSRLYQLKFATYQ